MRQLGQTQEPQKEAPVSGTVTHPVPEVMKPNVEELKEPEKQVTETSEKPVESIPVTPAVRGHFGTVTPIIGDNQKYKERAKCTCGWEGNFMTYEEGETALKGHYKAHS